ncbi:MAG: cyanophycinase [Elusimicrobiota bacterium]
MKNIFRGAVLAAALLPLTAATDKGYRYILTGNPEDAKASPKGGFILEGGADDPEEAMRWMIKRSGGGDFLVLRASDEDDMHNMVPELGKVDSVETFIFDSTVPAHDPFVIGKIDQADAIFFAGGDQSEYVRFWKNTPVQDAVNRAIKRGVPVGGISAGLAILGQFQFEAMGEYVTPERALKDPYGPGITLGRDFLEIPPLRGIITDTHFSQRGRLARLLVFMARLVQDGWTSDAKGIGVDEETAVIVEADGAARVTGKNEAVFVRLSQKPRICRPGEPLTAEGFEVVNVTPGHKFNIKKWKGSGRASRVDVVDGVLKPAH